MTTILIFLGVIGVLIVFHEFGHFLFAKLFGVGVKRFSVGFGKVLISKRFGETEYALSLIPLGGYVSMVDENEEEKEPVDPRTSFSRKPVWKRMIICLAGPGFNFLLAGIIYIAIFGFYGLPVLTTKVGGVTQNFPAEKAGLFPGDEIVNIQPVSKYDRLYDKSSWLTSWEEIGKKINESGGKELKILVKRGEAGLFEVNVTPKIGVAKNIFGEPVKGYFIGVQPAEPVYEKKGVTESFSGGIKASVNMTSIVVVGLWKIVSGKLSPSESVGGPILIAQAGKKALASDGFRGVLLFVSAMSVNLAVLNLLPIPRLDGGFMPFLLYEAVRGKPVKKETREKFFHLGFVFLMLLIFYALFNDIMRIISK